MNQHDPTDELGGTLASIPASRAPSPAPAPAPVPAPAGPGDSGGGLVGTVLADRYEVMKKLGEGGMGTVYVGRHRTIGKKSAIKVLSGELAARSDLVQRFLQEAKAASMISQENVVEITDFGDTPDGSVFFVMEYLQGECCIQKSATCKSNQRKVKSCPFLFRPQHRLLKKQRNVKTGLLLCQTLVGS